MEKGWWTLTINAVDVGFDARLTDIDREHIAAMIINGYREGELLQSKDEGGGLL